MPQSVAPAKLTPPAAATDKATENDFENQTRERVVPPRWRNSERASRVWREPGSGDNLSQDGKE